MTATKWKAIKADVPSKTVFKATINEGMLKVVDSPRKDLETFVGTWRAESKPKIQQKLDKSESALGNIIAWTGVESDWSQGKKANANDKLMFVARGTSVKHVIMPDHFKPKTSYRNVNSVSVRGNRDPKVVSKMISYPGIEAREIEEEIAEKHKTEIIAKLHALVLLASRKSGLGGGMVGGGCAALFTKREQQI